MRRFCIAGLVIFAVVLFAGFTVQAQEETRPRVLRPTAGTTVTAGLLEIFALIPEPANSIQLTLDGKPVAPKPLALTAGGNGGEGGSSTESLLLRLDPALLDEGVKASPVWVIVRKVEPGPHELVLGSERIKFRATIPQPGDLYSTRTLNSTSGTIYATHPMTVAGMLSCTACHQLNRDEKPPRFEDMSTLTPPLTPDVCFRCHPENKFLPTHAHRVEHLAACQLCHDPHGADRARLMKLRRDDACRKCHE